MWFLTSTYIFLHCWFTTLLIVGFMVCLKSFRANITNWTACSVCYPSLTKGNGTRDSAIRESYLHSSPFPDHSRYIFFLDPPVMTHLLRSMLKRQKQDTSFISSIPPYHVCLIVMNVIRLCTSHIYKMVLYLCLQFYTSLGGL